MQIPEMYGNQMLLLAPNNKCNGWNGQQPLARLNFVVPVCGWIRFFEKRISNYFWYKLYVAIKLKKTTLDFKQSLT